MIQGLDHNFLQYLEILEGKILLWIQLEKTNPQHNSTKASKFF